MSLGPPNQKLRTSVWRFTLLFTLLVFLISSSLLLVVYHFTIGEQGRQKTQQVHMTTQALLDLANTPQMQQENFQRLIQNRSQQSASLILALGVAGKYQGNISTVPENLSTFPDLSYFPIAVIDAAGETSVAMVLGSQKETPFGLLLVGVIDEDYLVRDVAFFSASGVGLIICLMITLVLGFFFNRSVLSRVKQIARLSVDVRAGNRDARLPLSKRNDEFDVIAYQINLMLDDIDELIGSVANVTDNIAHDLRTPLSRIRIAIEEKLRLKQLEPEQISWLEDLIEELDDVIATFNAMLELSRLESGVKQEKFKPVYIPQLCEDAMELTTALAEEKHQNLSFEIRGSTEPMMVLGEPNLLFRSVFNLLENAVKYTQEGGEISLIVSRRADFIDICISDNGPGIPEALHEQVFRRLCRLDASRTAKGYGLGLSIVKAIVELHNGSVLLEPVLPHGITVRLQIPAHHSVP